MCYWISNYEIQQAVYYSDEYWHKLYRHDRKVKVHFTCLTSRLSPQSLPELRKALD